MPVLPDVKSRVVFDDSALTKAAKTSATAHGAMQAHAAASTTHTLRFQESLTTMLGHIGGMPPVLDTAGRSLESMASTGVSGMQLMGGAALAGFGIVVEGAKMAIGSYMGLADQVENYKRVVGGSAEDAGKMVQTFQALGVGADTATSAMFKLSKAVETSPAKLEALGVSIAHDATGNINLGKTLLNVADAYNATGDQAKKNIILFDAFGKTGKDMIPVLEQGSAALQQLEASARLTFTQEDLDRARQMKVHTEEVKQSIGDVGASIGQTLIGPLDAAAQAYLKNEDSLKRLSDAEKAGKISRLDYATATTFGLGPGQALLDQYGKQWDAGHALKATLDQQTAATQEATAANEALWASADKLVTQIEAQANASYALQVANIAVNESQSKVNQAAEAYNAAVTKYGAGSDEAVLAAGSLSRSYLEQEKAYTDVGKAARKLQEDTDIASGSGKDFAKEITAEIDSLQNQADALAPSSPLRVYLDSYIKQLRDGIPADVSTYLHLQTDTKFGAAHFAEGGRPPVGVPSFVGERGPEVFVPDVPGTIVPHGMAATAAAQAASADGGGGGVADLARVEALLEHSTRLLDELIGVTIDNKPQGMSDVDLRNAVGRATMSRMNGITGVTYSR